MHTVIEIFKADSKRFWRYENKDRQKCIEWIARHSNELSAKKNLSTFVIK